MQNRHHELMHFMLEHPVHTTIEIRQRITNPRLLRHVIRMFQLIDGRFDKPQETFDHLVVIGGGERRINVAPRRPFHYTLGAFLFRWVQRQQVDAKSNKRNETTIKPIFFWITYAPPVLQRVHQHKVGSIASGAHVMV